MDELVAQFRQLLEEYEEAYAEVLASGGSRTQAAVMKDYRSRSQLLAWRAAEVMREEMGWAEERALRLAGGGGPR